MLWTHARLKVSSNSERSCTNKGLSTKPARSDSSVEPLIPQAGGSVFVTWQSVPDPSVVGYNVYRREANLTADKAVLVTTAQPVTTTSLSRLTSCFNVKLKVWLPATMRIGSTAG